MRPLDLIDKYYSSAPKARKILLAHSRLVAKLAVAVACNVEGQGVIDKDFLEQAAMLHDIGMLDTDTPALGCHGDRPYICHGIIGAEMLRKEGLPRHALVCERHIGVGLSLEDIKAQGLPLPLRDMQPQSIEEEIIAYADLFFSKTHKGMRTIERIRKSLSRYGTKKVRIFDRWHERFTHS